MSSSEKFELEKLSTQCLMETSFADSLYLKAPEDVRVKMENYLWEKAMEGILKYIDAQKHDFVCADETKISYIEIGKPEEGKESLVFLHGFGDHKENFFKVAKILSSHFHMILPDLPGFGESSKEMERTYSLPNYGKWFKELVEHKRLQSFHLMGNSLGGAAALSLARQAPEKIKSLSLLDTAAILPLNNSSVYHEINEGNVMFKINNLEEFNCLLNRVFVNQPFFPTPLKFRLFREYQEGRERFLKILNDFFEVPIGQKRPMTDYLAYAYNEIVPSMEFPSLILWGEKDTLFPLECAAILHSKMKNSCLVVLEDVGHSPQIEVPKKVATRFLRFINKIKDAPKA